jgi:uncharacterized membrane protein
MSEPSTSPDSGPPGNDEPEPTGLRPFRGPLVFSIAMTAVATGAAFWAWRQLPADARVPMHWNVAGEIDGYGGRGSLFLFPGMLLFLTALFAGLPFIEPRRANLLRSSRAYGALWITVVAFMLLIQGAVIMTAFGRPAPMHQLALGGTGVLLLVIGNYLGKVRSNFFFGVRTPWTLSSELSWNKTHRLAGRLFVAVGAALIVASLLGLSGRWLLFGLLGSLGVVAIVPIVYSYFIWRGDPGKTGAGS